MSHRYPLVSNYRNTFSIMKKKQHLHRLTYKSDVEKQNKTHKKQYCHSVLLINEF